MKSITAMTRLWVVTCLAALLLDAGAVRAENGHRSHSEGCRIKFLDDLLLIHIGGELG